MTIEMLSRARVLFGTGVAMMGSVEVTTLHRRGMGDPMLPPTLEVVPSSLEDSSRGVRRDGDPLCIIPMNMAPESLPWGERLRRPKQLAMNSRLPK
jgi:hypothetical protein